MTDGKRSAAEPASADAGSASKKKPKKPKLEALSMSKLKAEGDISDQWHGANDLDSGFTRENLGVMNRNPGMVVLAAADEAADPCITGRMQLRSLLLSQVSGGHRCSQDNEAGFVASLMPTVGSLIPPELGCIVSVQTMPPSAVAELAAEVLSEQAMAVRRSSDQSEQQQSEQQQGLQQQGQQWGAENPGSADTGRHGSVGGGNVCLEQVLEMMKMRGKSDFAFFKKKKMVDGRLTEYRNAVWEVKINNLTWSNVLQAQFQGVVSAGHNAIQGIPNAVRVVLSNRNSMIIWKLNVPDESMAAIAKSGIKDINKLTPELLKVDFRCTYAGVFHPALAHRQSGSHLIGAIHPDLRHKLAREPFCIDYTDRLVDDLLLVLKNLKNQPGVKREDIKNIKKQLKSGELEPRNLLYDMYIGRLPQLLPADGKDALQRRCEELQMENGEFKAELKNQLEAQPSAAEMPGGELEMRLRRRIAELESENMQYKVDVEKLRDALIHTIYRNSETPAGQTEADLRRRNAKSELAQNRDQVGAGAGEPPARN